MFPAAIVQTCIVHLIRGTFRYASKKYWEAIAKDLRPIYTAANAEAAWAAFEAFEEKWGKAYPAIPKLWRNSWEQFIPFLATTSRSATCSAPRTRSSRSPPATGARSTSRSTSPPSRPL